jgi:hypothetical protein
MDWILNLCISFFGLMAFFWNIWYLIKYRTSQDTWWGYVAFKALVGLYMAVIMGLSCCEVFGLDNLALRLRLNRPVVLVLMIMLGFDRIIRIRKMKVERDYAKDIANKLRRAENDE